MDMGKEAKIGVGVILGLFVVLCVVLAVRLSGSKEKALGGDSARNDAGSTGMVTSAGDSAMPRLAGPHRPTVLSASNRSTVTRKPPVDAGGWSVAADNASRDGSSASPSWAATPPSLMPNPSATPIHATAFTVTDSAAPSTIPVAAADSAVGATPAVAMTTVPSPPSVTSMPAVPSPPATTTLPSIAPPPPGTSFGGAPVTTSNDLSQRSGSQVGRSNPDGSSPALTATPPYASLPAGADANSATPSYSSASAYGSSSGGTSAGM